MSPRAFWALMAVLFAIGFASAVAAVLTYGEHPAAATTSKGEK
jgi:hypothetical protein